MSNLDPRPPQFFFVHIMKTAGTTLRHQAARNFAPDEMFPPPDPGAGAIEQLLGYHDVRRLVDLDPAVREHTRFFSGHVPFALAQLVCPAALTMAVVRDPLDRTLSFLRHCQRDYAEHQGKPLQEIYEDPWFFPRYIENHQTKIFAMTPAEAVQGQADPVFDQTDLQHRQVARELRDDPVVQQGLADVMRAEGMTVRTFLRASHRAPTEVVEVDADRLAAAKANVEKVDLLGTSEQLGVLLATLVERFGWQVDPGLRFNTTDPVAVPASFRARIEADNAADVELVEHVKRLCGLSG